MASKITQININIWIQETNLANETLFTKEQYIHSPQSRTLDLLLSHNHFQLLGEIPQFNQSQPAISNKDNKASKRKFEFKHVKQLTLPEKKQTIDFLPNICLENSLF